MSNEGFKLDEIDKQIIDIIQSEPNITHTDIAKRVERSQPTIGMRIKRLEQEGILQFQAGINLRVADMFYARAEIETNQPEEIMALVDKCHYMLNAFRLSGEINLSILLANSRISHLDDIINTFFRDNPQIKNVSLNIITDVLEDFVLPIELNFEDCDCPLKEQCIRAWELKNNILD